jgi:hypothetical protein
MWALRRMVRVDDLPHGRVVVLFRFRGYSDRQFWLVLQRPDIDLCLFDPGFEVDMRLEADVEAMARVCLGHTGLLQALKSGAVELSGPSHYRRALCGWLGVTRFAARAKTAAAR